MQPAVAAPAPPKQLLLRPGSSFARDPSDHLLRAETPRAGADATDARRSNAPASRGDVGFVGAADDDVAAAAIALYVPPTASAASSPSPPIHDRESGSHVTTLSLPSPVAPHRDNLQCPQDLSGISLLLTAENLSQTFAASASLPHLLQKQELDGNSTSHRKRVPLPQLPAQQYQLRQHRQTPLDGYFRDDDDFVNELSPVKKKRAQQQKSPDPSALPASAKEKSYPCLYPGCGKVFPRAYNLKSHYYCHSGERPHACGTCGACFSRKHDLQRHVRTLHAKDPPRICMPCKQSFASIELFQKHIRDAHHTPVAEVASTNNNKPGSTISQSQTVLGSEYGAQSTSGRPHIVYDGHSREAVPQQQNSDSDRHLISTHSTSFSASVRRRDGIGVLAEAAEVEMRKQQMRELQKSEADAVKVQPIPDEDDDAFDDDDGDVDDGDDEDYDATASGRPEIFVKKNLH